MSGSGTEYCMYQTLHSKQVSALKSQNWCSQQAAIHQTDTCRSQVGFLGTCCACNWSTLVGAQMAATRSRKLQILGTAYSLCKYWQAVADGQLPSRDVQVERPGV